jgi:hypothetical protein
LIAEDQKFILESPHNKELRKNTCIPVKWGIPALERSFNKALIFYTQANEKTVHPLVYIVATPCAVTGLGTSFR